MGGRSSVVAQMAKTCLLLPPFALAHSVVGRRLHCRALYIQYNCRATGRQAGGRHGEILRRPQGGKCGERKGEKCRHPAN